MTAPFAAASTAGAGSWTGAFEAVDVLHPSAMPFAICAVQSLPSCGWQEESPTAILQAIDTSVEESPTAIPMMLKTVFSS